jgi:ABC-type transport system substrate-binding protein
MTLRAAEPKLSDPAVRKGILGLLDVDLLAAVGAGSDNTVTLAQAQVRAPSDPGYVPTAPPALGRQRALELLEQAGFQIDRTPTETPVQSPPSAGSRTPAPQPGPPEITRGRISKNGETLSLVIGVAANDPTSVAVANTAADQLRSVGIAATVLALDPPVLYGEALVNNRVDAIVGWHAAGGDLATLLASRYGCPALQATAVSTAPTTPPTGTAPSPSTSPSQTTATPTPTTPPSPAPESGALVQAPSNLTGICDRSIQPNIDAALDGSAKIDDVINLVEPRLWNMSAVLPILQDTTIVAVGPSVQNVSLSGAVPVGIVGDAGRWAKAAQ